MLTKTYSNPETVAPPFAHYSHIVSVDVGGGALLFLSGQVPVDAAAGNLVGEGDIGRQTEQVFANMRAALEAHGASVNDVVATTSFITDMSQLAAVNEVRARQFPNTAPTSTAVEVSARIGAVRGL